MIFVFQLPGRGLCKLFLLFWQGFAFQPYRLWLPSQHILYNISYCTYCEPSVYRFLIPVASP